MKPTQHFWKYFKWKLKANNKHDVHSPFVFKLLTEIIENKKNKPDYKFIKEYNQLLSDNTRVIEVSDLGAKQKGRKVIYVSDTIKNHHKEDSLKPKQQKLLYRLTEHFAPKQILELGTGFGSSTFCMSKASSDAQIHTIDGCANTLEIADNYLQQFKQKHISFYNGNFIAELQQVLKDNAVFDMIFIDGEQREKKTFEYFELCLNNINEDSFIIINDIHLSADKEADWEKICQHPQVSISIDLFKFGLVFFRTGIPKQNFILNANY